MLFSFTRQRVRMSAPSFCPACDVPLALFTPREALAHVNQCLDAQQGLASRDGNVNANAGDVPSCAICSRDLSTLTEAARNDHVNRCVDSNLPLPPQAPRRPPRRARQRPASVDPANGNQITHRQMDPTGNRSAKAEEGDSRVNHLLEMLGLSRFAARFAREEIDLVALRLLSEDDLATMSIPESGRRRIADAMHSVEILAELQRKFKNEPPTRSDTPNIPAEYSEPSVGHGRNAEDGNNDEIFDAPPVPTQHFARSRLQQRIGESFSKPPLNDVPDEEDYNPTMYVQDSLKSPVRNLVSGHSEHPLNSNSATPHCAKHREKDQARTCDEARTVNNEVDNDTPPRPSTTLSNMGRNASSSHGRTNSTEPFDNVGIEVHISADSFRNTWERSEDKHQIGQHTGDCARQDCSKLNLTGNCDNLASTSEGVTPSSQDSSGSAISSLASDLGNMSEALRYTSQISMDMKLKKWREQQIEREKHRHKRILERIEQKYAKAFKQSFGRLSRIRARDSEDKDNGLDDDDDDNSDDIGFSHDVIDLTQDFSDGARPDSEGKGGEDKSGEAERTWVARENKKQWTVLSQSVSSSSIPPLNDGRETDKDEGVLKKSSEDIESCDGDRAQRSVQDGNSDESSEEILSLLGLEHGKESVVDDADDFVVDDGNGEAENDSDENVLDLVDMDGNENEFGSAMKGGDEDEEIEGTQSRLKKRCKRPKACRDDIIGAIEADGELHDDILLMHSVSFNRIWGCLKGQDLNVSRKAVHEFLLKEGIMFKGESATRPSSQNYLRRLNADPRDE